jgi:5-methylcytosine-specific restriction enzyme A
MRHGYADGWTADGIFRYFGEGQEGDMRLAGGNRAIAEHAAAGKDLLLFQTLGGGQVRFLGPFTCSGYDIEQAPDRLGAQRNATVFLLMPEDSEIGNRFDGDTLALPVAASDVSLSELRRGAMTAARNIGRISGSEARRSYYMRSEIVRKYVLRRAAGQCECCGHKAPFITSAGEPYLEPHHIRRLGDGGPDDPRFMGAVCPNCHAEIHYGSNGGSLNNDLQSHVNKRERALDRGAVRG